MSGKYNAQSPSTVQWRESNLSAQETSTIWPIELFWDKNSNSLKAVNPHKRTAEDRKDKSRSLKTGNLAKKVKMHSPI